MILVTGGAGYIGSHVVVELLQAGKDVLVLDNLCNSVELALHRASQVSGRVPVFIRGDIRDRVLLDRTLAKYPIDEVIHVAGLKAVGESVLEPLRYYENNVAGTITLCQAMAAAGVFRLVFSSSATVYGESATMPIREDCPTGIPTNPYGQSKLMAENVLKALSASDQRWEIAILRYFNPIGAHESGIIGEDPDGIPNNLLPYLLHVAIGRLPKVFVYGNDYPTPDGTGVRDYIHVVDLAKGHLYALNKIAENSGVSIWNLGTGRGYSVLELISTLEIVSGMVVPIQVVPRRTGDIAQCWADPNKAATELGWRAVLNLKSMVTDAWRWQLLNPQGYRNVTKTETALAG